MLFTFPSRYWFAIGLTGVFSLAGWSRRVRAGFLVSRATQDPAAAACASRKGLSPATAGLSRPFRSRAPSGVAVLLPARFGLFPVRSPLLGESLLFSLPGGTKMFQFPPFASRANARDTATRAVGCPIRRSAGQGPFAPNRGFSQLITSFVASVSQGIRHAPFITFLSSTRAKARGGGSYFQL